MKINNLYKSVAVAAVAILALGSEAQGVTIFMSPGELMNSLPSATIEGELVLNGSIDIRDFNTLREIGREDVKVLDLSATKISSFNAPAPLHLGKSLFKADQLPAYALFNTAYETVKLPAGIKKIEDGALAGSSIKSIEIPEGVTSVGAYAFYNCPNLETVTLPTSLTSIGRNAFSNCPKLEYINLGETAVKTIPEECFAGDVSLTNIDAPQVLSVDSRAMAGSGIENVTLSQVGSLAPFALADMPNLMVLTVSPQTKFAEGSLMNCVSLMSINGTPENVPDLFVANCPNLPAEEILSNASSIGRYALANTGMSTIVLGNKLASIDENAFKGAQNLGYIEAEGVTESVPEADASAFAGLDPSQITLHVNDSLIDDWKNHPVWGEFDITSNGTTGVSSAVADAQGDIRVTIKGGELIITAPEAIQAATIYDLSGKVLKHIAGGSTQVTADLSDVPSGVNLVSVRTASGFKGVKIVM